MSASQRYRAVVRAPGVARLLGSVILARSPIGIEGLAIVLLVRETTGSYAAAGAVAAAYTVGACIAGPFLGRAVDRRGARRVLPPIAVINACALAAILVLAEAGAPTPLLVLDALLAGLALPPIGSVMRRMWVDLVEPELLTTAYALDSVLVEAAFVIGPLFVAAIAAVANPGYALPFAGAAVLTGTIVFCTSEGVGRHAVAATEQHEGGMLGALRTPGVRTVVLSILPIGFCLGATEVAFPAFGEAIGDKALGGPLIAFWSLGSGVGGLLYGARGHAIGAVRAYRAGVVLVPLVTLPLILPSTFAGMVPLALLAGACIAPTLIATNELIGVLAPIGARTEAFTWPITALLAGVSSGNAVSGALIEAHSWEAGFLVAACAGATSVLIANAFASTLQPAPQV